MALIIANWEKLAPYFEALAAKLKGIFDGISSFVSPLIDKIMAPFEKQKTLELQTQMKAEMGDVIGGSLELKQEELDELTRSTRAILRNVEGKDDKQVAEELWSKMSEVRQSDTSQRQMRAMLHSELASRKELSEERRAAIEGAINDRQYVAKESSVEAVTKTLEEYASKLDLSKGADRAAFMSVAKEALTKRTDISGEEKAAILSEVKSRTERAASREALTSELKAAMTDVRLKTLTEQSAAVEKMLKISEQSGADLTAKRAAMEQEIQTKGGLSESERSEMVAQMRAGMQSEMDARLGEQVRAAITKTSDQKALVAALSEVLSSQKDQSTEAMREMSETVKSGLKTSGKYEAKEISEIVSTIEKRLASRKSESKSERERQTWESVPEPVEKKQSTMQEASEMVPWMQRPWQWQSAVMPQTPGETTLTKMLTTMPSMLTAASGAEGGRELTSNLSELSKATNAASTQMQSVGTTTSDLNTAASTHLRQ